MSKISVGTTLTTGLIFVSDTSGDLQFDVQGYVYTWPSLDGSAGEFLTTDGGGALSWTAAAGLPPVIIANTVSVTAVAGNHYVLTAVSLTTVTLPASPTLSDTVYVTVANGLTTNVVANNGKPIQSISESLTLDSAYASVQLRFTDDTKGWIFA